MFFLEAFGGAHLQSIRGVYSRRRLHLGLQTEPGRGGCLVGISPQTPRNGLPPHQALGQPDPLVRLDRAGWTDPVVVMSGPESQGPEVLFPWCDGPSLRPLQLGEQMISCRCKRLMVR